MSFYLLWSLHTIVFQPVLGEWRKWKNTAVCSSKSLDANTRIPNGPNKPFVPAPKRLHAIWPFSARSSGGIGPWLMFGFSKSTSMSSCKIQTNSKFEYYGRLMTTLNLPANCNILIDLMSTGEIQHPAHIIRPCSKTLQNPGKMVLSLTEHLW